MLKQIAFDESTFLRGRKVDDRFCFRTCKRRGSEDQDFGWPDSLVLLSFTVPEPQQRSAIMAYIRKFMMSTVRKIDFITVEDFLAGEQESAVKHEYVAGRIYAMSETQNAHNIIASSVLGSMGQQLQGKPCRAFNSDTKIRVRMSNQTRFYYPDASVICRPNPQSDVFQDLPSVIVEVLSESTRRIDDGEKREVYLTIPSLTHYILLEQSAIGAVVYERGSAGFERRVLTELTDSIPLPELHISLSLAAVYDGIEFSDE